LYSDIIQYKKDKQAGEDGDYDEEQLSPLE
jgi:hypothetical protein